jgi:hypothetical protein
MTTIDGLRHTWTEDTKVKLTALGCPQEDLERQAIAHMNTISDDMLVAAWQRAGRDIAAWKAAEAAQAALYAADHERKKVAATTKKATDDHLARERKATEVAVEEAETWQRRSKSLEGQLSALMERQGR